MKNYLSSRVTSEYCRQRALDLIYCIGSIGLILVCFGCATVVRNGKASAIQSGGYALVGDIDRVEFEEPSGISYHPGRNTIFVIGDEGDIAELKLDGTPINSSWLRDGDFEGITVDPSTGLLYVAEERAEKVIEVDPDSLVPIREFTVPREFNGKLVLQPGEEGFEGITFVPIPQHPEGGIFFVAQQSFDLSNESNPSAVLSIELPLRSSSAEQAGAKIISIEIFDQIDLAGLHYNTADDRLLILSGSHHKVFLARTDVKVFNSFIIPGDDQEGITEDREGNLYLTQDNGGILKLSPKGQ